MTHIKDMTSYIPLFPISVDAQDDVKVCIMMEGWFAKKSTLPSLKGRQGCA